MPHKFTVGNASRYREGMNVKLKSLILKDNIGCRRKQNWRVVECQDRAHWILEDSRVEQTDLNINGLCEWSEWPVLNAEILFAREKYCGKFPTMRGSSPLTASLSLHTP